MFEKDYGLEHSHQFAMYAINVSLFCLLAQKDFDILDPDFLSLTKGFSIVACRSQVGRHLFRAFKITIRSRSQAGLITSPEDVPPGIRELLGPRKDYFELDKWDYNAEYLAEVEGERSFIKDIGTDPTVPGLHQMLKWYEKLSMGEEAKMEEELPWIYLWIFLSTLASQYLIVIKIFCAEEDRTRYDLLILSKL